MFRAALSNMLASMGWHDPAATLGTCSKTSYTSCQRSPVQFQTVTTWFLSAQSCSAIQLQQSDMQSSRTQLPLVKQCLLSCEFMDIMLTGAVRMVPSSSSGIIFLLSLGFCRSCALMYSQIFFTTCDTSILSMCIAVVMLAASQGNGGR